MSEKKEDKKKKKKKGDTAPKYPPQACAENAGLNWVLYPQGEPTEAGLKYGNGLFEAIAPPPINPEGFILGEQTSLLEEPFPTELVLVVEGTEKAFTFLTSTFIPSKTSRNKQQVAIYNSSKGKKKLVVMKSRTGITARIEEN